MNIPTNKLKDFTKAVAEFSTVTGMEVESASTAFGRFGEMMGKLQESAPGKGDGYAVLANQIADLGAKSVATEPEIANMAVSIAARVSLLALLRMRFLPCRLRCRRSLSQRNGRAALFNVSSIRSMPLPLRVATRCTPTPRLSV